MEEDQGESIKYIHKYRDEVTNEIKYCVDNAKRGCKQKSNRASKIFKQKEVDIDRIHELCKDQGNLGWYNRLVFKAKTNSTFEFPIASMRKVTDVNDIPKRLEGAPSIQFIQSARTYG